MNVAVPGPPIAIRARRVGRRYGRRWALRHLTFDIPERAIVGLVGPNGAGKSTLLHLLTGLIDATEGIITVLGSPAGRPAVLPDVAFVAQDAPLPRRFTIGRLEAAAKAMNVRWDNEVVAERLRLLGLDDARRVDTLSGGQRAQLALALALAKQPRLLVLDEPVAALDPLARRSFLGSVMAAVAERELTVIFSTHLLDDLERVCDHLIVLSCGSVRTSGSIDDIVAGHRILIGPPDRPLPRGAGPVGGSDHAVGYQRLVRLERPVADPIWEQVTPSLEEIVLAHLEDGPEPRRLEVV